MNEKFTIFKNECGIIISDESKQLKMQDLYHEVVPLFEENGVITFRDFNIKPEEITDITNKYTEKYSGEALRRSSQYGQRALHDVDQSGINSDGEIVSGGAVDFHSESSFSPTWPEIIWFYCSVPPKTSGNTILCDGIKLWKKLSIETKSFFLANPIRYQLEIPIAKERTGKGKRPWFLENIGTGDSYIDWDSGILHATQLRYAVHEGRSPKDLCFTNHLFVSLDSEPQLISRTMANGKEIPIKILEEINDQRSL